MKKYIVIGFQNHPKNAPKILKTFFNGTGDFITDSLRGRAGITSAKLEIKYSEGIENAIIFDNENEAGCVQQTLSSSWHGRHNCWCVREISEENTIEKMCFNFYKTNRHIYENMLPASYFDVK